MRKIDTIVWDVGNVFVYWDPRRVYADDARFDAATAQDWAERVIKAPWAAGEYGWNSEVDRGQTIAETLAARIERFPTAFPELAQKLPDYANLLSKYFNEWAKSFDEVVPGTRELRDQFKAAGYRTLALTNFSAETWPMATTMFPHLDQFDAIIMSGRVCMVKPDRDIFEYMFKVHNIEPAKAVFIDDSQPNIDTAREMGLNAILFVPNRAEPEKALQRLKADLAALGIT